MSNLGPGTTDREGESIPIVKWLTRAALLLLLLSFVSAYLFFSGKVSYLVLNRHATIEVNGVPVKGEILEGRASAVVTRRDAGKVHSYQLFFEGDVDMTGNMGSVVGCPDWVAPHVPFLLETRGYPPCNLGDGTRHWSGPLIYKGNFMQFIAEDQSTIRIKER